MPHELHLGDCLEVMRTLESGSVDAVVTDPPYGTTALAYDRSEINWKEWWKEAKRVTKRNAAFVIFSQLSLARKLIDLNEKSFRYELIWHKNQPTGFRTANKLPMRNHEYVLIFGDSIKWNKINWKRVKRDSRQGKTILVDPKNSGHYSCPTGKTIHVFGDYECPKSILDRFSTVPHTGKTRKDFYHPSQKPVPLLSWLIESYSDVGNLVFDPFMGTASCGEASFQTGRNFIGVEVNPEYHAIATKRLDSISQDLPLFGERPKEADSCVPSLGKC